MIKGVEEEIIGKIKKSEAKDNKIARVVKKMKKAGVKRLINDKWQIENDLVLKERKVYITKDKNLRLEIFQLHRETLIVGYGG